MTRLSLTHVKHILDIYEVYRLLRSCLNIKQYTNASTHNQCRIHYYYTTFFSTMLSFFLDTTQRTATTSRSKERGFVAEEVINWKIWRV